MDKKIRIGINGYGNLGKGVESEIGKNPDMELKAIFTRRKPPESLNTKTNVPKVHADDIKEWADRIDVMIMCGGSKSDLPAQVPVFAKFFNTVDSFDTHAKIPEFYEEVDKAAREGNKISIISAGWDPGLFSMLKLYTGAIIPEGQTYSFWGPGVSQGHSEAIRGIKGVANAVQYTIPSESALDRIRKGETPELTTREKHKRICYVVLEDEAGKGAVDKKSAEKDRIENEIKNMPYYFAEYDTSVTFISQEELEKDHAKMKHGGFVIHTGVSGESNKQIQEYSLKLDSNPEFTSSVLIAFARAAYRLAEKGETGARTILDIPPALLSPLSPEEQRKAYL